MGVDFYACRNCGETFPDCGDFVGCECGEHWCSRVCAETDGYKRHDCDEEGCDEESYCEYEDDSSCKYCREEDFEDYELLVYSLSLLNMNREKLIEQYKSVKHLIK